MSFQIKLTKWEQVENSTSHYYYNIIQNCYGLFLKFSKKSIDEYDKDIDLMIDTLHTYCCNTWMTLV